MRGTAEKWLRCVLRDQDARFRDDQWECIETLLGGERLLLVQRTGWGKSMVYFLATRLLRDRGRGPTLLISPLLSLMRNQLLASERLGLRAVTINSTNVADWNDIQGQLQRNTVDLLLVSPERLANEEFQRNVLEVLGPRVGLFVVDEAHCISDWGHDFRPNYRRIVRVIGRLPRSTPVLATTATANDRVVEDIRQQLGDLRVVRGPLMRRGLMLQTLAMPDAAARLAWLADVVPGLPGSGIVYTLTVRDAECVAEWLRRSGIAAKPYHADSPDRETLENDLLENRVKVLAATVALGMGFDKPDLGFVIHYQRPGSVVHYYQQVGRAGRAVPEAYGFLLGGAEDDEIADYFLRSAMPPPEQVEALLALLRGSRGLGLGEMQRHLNLSRNAIERILSVLAVEDPPPVRREKGRWVACPGTGFVFDRDRARRLSQSRQAEQEEMARYMRAEQCLMRFLSRALSDPDAHDCGICARCVGRPLLSETPTPERVREAVRFLKRADLPIEPRRRWPDEGAFNTYRWRGKISEALTLREGRALCLWGDAGWGQQVRRERLEAERFSDDLVAACVETLERWRPVPPPRWVACIPSQTHPDLLPDFAARLAEALGLPFVPVVERRTQRPPQTCHRNAFLRARNLDGAFALAKPPPSEPVLLLDDVVDSRWTLTVVGALLRQRGCPAVHPLALAQGTITS